MTTDHHPLEPGLRWLTPDLLYSDEDNVRTNSKPGDTADLQASIRALGLLQPLVVTWVEGTEGHGNGYKVLAGNRRLRACEAVGLAIIPCMVREAGTAGEDTLVQLSENMVRQDMSAIDVFCGVQRLAEEGMDDTAIGIALNQSDKRVAQLRAMGRLHPDLVEHIRRTGSMPGQHDMAIICQARWELQAEGFKAGKAGKGQLDWWKVARACTVKRIPLAHAWFELTRYTGPVFRDLFADGDAEAEAEDAPLFMKLQTEAVEAKLEAMRGEGLQAAMGVVQYSELTKPGDCDWPALTPKKLPAKTKRSKHRYVAGILDDGRVVEAIYALKATAKEQKAAAAGAAGAAAAAVPAKPKPVITQKGEGLVDRAKRKAVGDAVRMVLGSTDALAVALLILADKYGKGRGVVSTLFTDVGALEVDAENRDFAVMKAARTLLPQLIDTPGFQYDVAPALVDRIGAGFGVVPELLLDEDSVGTLKREPLYAAAKKAKLHDLGGWKQIEIRKALVKLGTIIRAEELPALGCDPKAALGYGWPKPGQSAADLAAEEEAEAAEADAPEAEPDEQAEPEGEDGSGLAIAAE